MFRALEPQHVEEHYVQSTGTSTCGGTLCSAMSPDSAYGTWIIGSRCGEDVENTLLIAALIE